MTMQPPVVIIGGGALGSAIAHFLASSPPPRADVVVVERDPTYRFASSALSASSIRQQFSTPINIRLSQFGYEFMQSLSEGEQRGAGVDFHAAGYLFIGQRQQTDTLRQRADLARAHGVQVEDYGREDLARLFPWMGCADLDYGSRSSSGEGWFDGYKLLQWYRNAAREEGVRYVRGEVAALEMRGVKVSAVELTDGTCVEASSVVNAAGAWSAQIANLAGLELPIRARRRTVFMASCPTPLADFPILVDTSGVFVRREDTRYLCVVSPSAEDDRDDLPLDPDVAIFDERIWPALAERVPAFEALRVERAWAGYYELNTVDHNGLVGQFGPENFYVAAGFSGHGLMHSAGIGRGMAELLTHGEYRSLDLSPLSPERLKNGCALSEDAIY